MVLISAQFHCTLRDLQATSNIAAIHGHFSGDEVQTPRLYNCLDTFKALLQDYLDLLECIGFVYKPIVADSRADLLLHTLRKVHSVRYRDDQKSRVLVTWPIE